MTASAQGTLLAELRRELERTRHQAERALAQVDDDRFFAALGDDDNSLAILVKHVAGNLRSRWRDFLTTDGEKPDRDRDREFELAAGDTREALMERWVAGWEILATTLEELEEADLDRRVTIRGEAFTVQQALLRGLGHYAYHAGQIVLLARHHAGERWQTLSVPRGGSAAFNRRPQPYLGSTEAAEPRPGAR